jgi:hypothetical protein
MLGKIGQLGLFEADTLSGDFVGKRAFYGYLASEGGELFRRHRRCQVVLPEQRAAERTPNPAGHGAGAASARRRLRRQSHAPIRLRSASEGGGIELEVRPFAEGCLQEFRVRLIMRDQRSFG